MERMGTLMNTSQLAGEPERDAQALLHAAWGNRASVQIQVWGLCVHFPAGQRRVQETSGELLEGEGWVEFGIGMRNG